MERDTWWQRAWYGDGVAGLLLAPLGFVYRGVAAARRAWWLQRGPQVLPVPVIVVGNVTVGGTGKTPLVVWLVERLAAAGRRPGIVTRGYRGRARDWPQDVTPDSDPREVGDEAVLLAAQTGVPVAAAPDRVAAARAVIARGADVVVADDGLQHYRLPRDLEIAVVDGTRGLGNGRCLPAGPLREPATRLATVDFVVINGGDGDALPGVPHGLSMHMHASEARSLATGERRALQSFAPGPVHAVAGIGNPARFSATLSAAGLQVRLHAFPDHHPFTSHELEFDDDLPVLMTEKDAIKCRDFDNPRLWAVPAQAHLPEPGATRLLAAANAVGTRA